RGAADLNHDGHPDLVFGERDYYIVRSRVTMMDSTVLFCNVSALQTGPGDVLIPAPRRIRVDQVDSPSALLFADFDEDGRTDIAVCGNGVAILLDRGHDGTWDWEVHNGPSSMRHTFLAATVIGDFDGDGHMDLAASLYGRGTDVWVLR